MVSRYSIVILLIAVLCAHTGMAAGTNAAADDADATEVTADRIEYARDKHVLTAAGNVVIHRGGRELRADRVTVKTDTSDVWASGNVSFKSKDAEWRGEDRIYCNLQTEVVRTGGSFDLRAGQISVHGEQAEMSAEGEVTGRKARVTSCELAHPDHHYHISAHRVSMIPGEMIQASHVFFYLGGIPVLYVPYWRERQDGYGLRVRPGYTSRMGFFVLTSYGYRLTDVLGMRTHVDYRTERGIALGHDIEWASPDDRWQGSLMVYYAHDKKPIDDDDDLPEGAIDNDRYRVLFSHKQKLSKRSYMLTRLSYLSDTDILEDFFRSQYTTRPRPENYVSLVHRGDNYTASLLARGRLNDFYGVVSRLPEASVRVPTTQIGDSRFFYGGHVSASMLEVEREVGDDDDEYGSTRIDTIHTVSSARKVWFLNFVPQASYRGTYYSSVVSEEAGAENFRSVFGLGAQTSFKAFKVLRDHTDEKAGMRHVVQPYVNYTFVPEPNLLSADLHQFDSVDEIGASHVVQLGVRNKLQAKTDSGPFDIIDIDIWSYGNLDAEDDDDTFSVLNIDAEFRPRKWLAFDLDAELAFSGDALQEANAHVIVGNPERTRGDIEYRYRADDSSLLAGEVTYDHAKAWRYRYAARYELEEGTLQSQSVWIQRNYDCMHAAVGVEHTPGYTTSSGTEKDTEYRFLFKLWIKAFPRLGVAIQ